MNRRALFYLVVIVAFTTGSLLAQEITGGIRGVVKDASGALVSGAKIDVINTDRNTTIRTLTTGSDGSYVAPYLPVGHYQIVVEAPGFKKFLPTPSSPCVEKSSSRELTRPLPDPLLSHCLRRVHGGARETLNVVLARRCHRSGRRPRANWRGILWNCGRVAPVCDPASHE